MELGSPLQKLAFIWKAKWYIHICLLERGKSVKPASLENVILLQDGDLSTLWQWMPTLIAHQNHWGKHWVSLSETGLSGLGGTQSALDFKSSLNDLMHSQGWEPLLSIRTRWFWKFLCKASYLWLKRKCLDGRALPRLVF